MPLKKEIVPAPPKKQPQMKKKKVLFPQDNVPCPKSIAIMAKLHELHLELLLHPPYSPDLAPSDYWLFTDLKRMLQGKRFGFNEEVISETVAYFEVKDKSFDKNGIGLSVGISVSPKRATLLKKVKFCIKVVALFVRPRISWVMCYFTWLYIHVINQVIKLTEIYQATVKCHFGLLMNFHKLYNPQE